jgi:DHA1 family tetracycline resistance protein-like MFS transporter
MAIEHSPRRAASSFIFFTLALDSMAMGMVAPVGPQLIQTIGRLDTATTASLFGLFTSIFALAQFLCAPAQGLLSDRFGRRPIILSSNLGLGIDFLIMATAPNLAWLFVGRTVSGIFAGSASAAYAYLVDVSPPEKRAMNFSLAGAAAVLGMAAGPAVGGLLGTLNLRAPFWVAAGLCLINFLYGLFVLPESLAPERRGSLGWAKLNPIGALWALIRDYPALLRIGAALALLTVVGQTVSVVIVLYTTTRYRWTPADVGSLLMVFGLASTGVQVAGVPYLVGKLGEWATMLIGIGLQIAGMILVGMATTGLGCWLGFVVVVLGAVGGPAWQALMSRTVSPSDIGRLTGAMTSISAIACIAGPWLFANFFAAVLRDGGTYLPLGSPFYLCAVMTATGLAIAAYSFRSTGAIRPAEVGGQQSAP